MKPHPWLLGWQMLPSLQSPCSPMLIFLLREIFPHSPGWHRTHYIAQAFPDSQDLPASVSRAQRLQAWSTTCGYPIHIFLKECLFFKRMKMYSFYVSTCFACVHVCMCTTHVLCAWGFQKVIRSPGAGIRDGEQVLYSTQISLQPWFSFLVMACHKEKQQQGQTVLETVFRRGVVC